MSTKTLTTVRDWDLPSGVKALRVNGYDMAYVESGIGIPVIFVHGAGVDYRYFGPQMGPFAAKYRAIAVSLRHYYPELWKGKGDFSLKQQVADLVAFIRAMNAGPVHLVGHSRGGTAALYVAKEAPELVHTLTIAEGGTGMPAFMPAGTGGLGDRKAVYDAIAEKFNKDDMEGGLEIFSNYVSGPGAWMTSPEVEKQWFRDNAWTLVGAARDQWDAFTREDAGRIEIPVLLLGGDNSPAQFGRVLDNIQSCLNDPVRAVVRDSSHSMPMLNPAGFNEAVLMFLAKH